METPLTISLIGSGNVATHLAKAWAQKGVIIRHIISKNKINADLLGEISFAQKTGDSLFDLDDLSDFYLIAVQDDHIEDIIDSFPFCLTGNQIVLHTSGTFDEHKLEVIAKNYGCLYPLQTFSKTKEVDLKNTPFLYLQMKKKVLIV
ncbi:MAG: NAD(P)-binding domain-containing protein [Saprospiraceae bacterium]|nr:NAD(P)-binding domain-containing protein [Saprospiraceae bacterium]